MYLDIFARLLLVFGGLNYLFTAITQKNESMIVRLLMLSVGLSAVYFLFDRDFYLPFLGKCVFPVAENQQKETADLKPVLLSNLPPNTNVVFWAAKRATSTASQMPNPIDAYSEYANSGIAKTNEKGEVTLQIACPVEYNVHYKTLRRHIHYRYELPKYRGMFSKVHTHFLTSECT
jgi:hypothetical protein